MNKVLVITYYWPPAGGAGVQRWLKFVKYLRSFGWEPIVYTPENGELPDVDESLLKDIPEGITVIKRPIREPYGVYKKLTGQKKEDRIRAAFLTEKKKPSMMERISVWIRGNFFIPDARKFWIRPSVKFLTAYLKEHPVDIIVSTGPPHSMHCIGLKLKRKLNIPWVADFRDPWTGIDFYSDLMLSKSSDRKHRRMEKEVLTEANAVITIGKTMADEFHKIVSRDYCVITNGFDEEDYQDKKPALSEKFSITHAGSLVKTRNPVLLWKVLSSLLKENNHFKNDLEIHLIGKVDYSVMESIAAFGLEKYVRKTDYLPHSEVITEQMRSQLLLLLINDTANSKGILTGKFFEYLASGRPVLAIGPEDGDIAAILNETKAGKICGFSNEEQLLNIVKTFYQDFQEGILSAESYGTEGYSRKRLTEKLTHVFSKAVEKNRN
jgi:glycosyltransferase involved in cell wall biosynthesis